MYHLSPNFSPGLLLYLLTGLAASALVPLQSNLYTAAGWNKLLKIQIMSLPHLKLFNGFLVSLEEPASISGPVLCFLPLAHSSQVTLAFFLLLDLALFSLATGPLHKQVPLPEMFLPFF